MDLQGNMAQYIRRIMVRDNKSFSELAAEWGISRNALYGYSTGGGNPTILTLQNIAEKTGDDPAVMISDGPVWDQKERLYALLETIPDVQALTEDDRQRFVELYLEMVKLWDQK